MNIKILVIEIKHHQLKNIFTKLDILKIHHKNLKKSDKWKIQLAIAINFIFNNDNHQERVMHSKSNNAKFMNYDNAEKAIEKINS